MFVLRNDLQVSESYFGKGNINAWEIFKIFHQDTAHSR
jgi:hypothetical protein